MSSCCCENCGWLDDINGISICGYSGRPTVRHDSCMAWKPQNKTVTNADRIRAMSDEELAYLLVHNPWMREESALSWLKSPVEG